MKHDYIFPTVLLQRDRIQLACPEKCLKKCFVLRNGKLTLKGSV